MHTSRHSPYTPLNLAGLGQDIFKHPPNTFCPLWVLWPLTGRPGRPEPGPGGRRISSACTEALGIDGLGIGEP